jgi:hypothetical protein
MSTAEQREVLARLRAAAPAHRVVLDAEGFPMIPGRRSLRGPGNPEGRDRLDWIGGAEPFACFIAARTKQGLGQKLSGRCSRSSACRRTRRGTSRRACG